MKNLEEFITKSNEVERGPISDVFDMMFDIVNEYTGPEKNHKAVLMQIKTSVNEGLTTESTARNKMLVMLKNVCLEEKVL